MQIPLTRNVATREPGSGPSRKIQDRLTIFLFLLPAIVLFLVFLIYPIIRSAYYSLFDWNGFGPAVNFVGLDNFAEILTDQVFMKAMATDF